MRNISEEEARALVSFPLRCEGDGDWLPVKIQPATRMLGAGVMNEDGVSTQMYVELIYKHSHKTRMTSYCFTLFKRFGYGKERVYQLAVTQSQRRLNDAHKLSHQHMGDCRTAGDAAWENWGYDEVLAHFCKQCNLTFEPVPRHPEHFQLSGG